MKVMQISYHLSTGLPRLYFEPLCLFCDLLWPCTVPFGASTAPDFDLDADVSVVKSFKFLVIRTLDPDRIKSMRIRILFFKKP